MVVIFMPFLPNLAVFLGISVWYLVPTYWIVVIYRFIESNLAIWQKNLEKAFLLLRCAVIIYVRNFSMEKPLVFCMVPCCLLPDWEYLVISDFRHTVLLSEFLTKITEFLDFGATFDLDRIFSFFFILKMGARHPPPQNRVFGRCLKNGKVAPKCHI